MPEISTLDNLDTFYVSIASRRGGQTKIHDVGFAKKSIAQWSTSTYNGRYQLWEIRRDGTWVKILDRHLYPHGQKNRDNPPWIVNPGTPKWLTDYLDAKYEKATYAPEHYAYEHDNGED